jgi:thiamine kinase
VQLSAYLAGRSLSADDLQNPQQLAEAVALLRWLHQSDAVFQGRWPIFETLADYLHWVGPHWSAGFAALSRDLQALRPELENKAWPFCACHCDPNPANFYKAGRLWLLDWEYSAWAEPAWDLAGLVAEAGLDSARQRQLLRYYLGRDDADLQRRIALYLPCLHTLAAAWGAAQIGLGNHTAKDSAAYVDKRLALARQQLQSLSFG